MILIPWIRFVNHLLRANDNSNNDYIDNYYLAALLRAAGNFKPADPLPPHDVFHLHRFACFD